MTPSPVAAPTVAALAAALGRSRQTLFRWRRRADWPFGPSPPWRVDAVRAWAEATLSPDPSAVSRAPAHTRALSAERRARLAQIRERTLKIRQDRLVAAGKLHATAPCESRRLAQIHAVKAGLMDLPRALGQELLGVADRVQFESAVMRHVTAILTSFANGAPSRDEAPAPPTPAKPKKRKPKRKESSP